MDNSLDKCAFAYSSASTLFSIVGYSIQPVFACQSAEIPIHEEHEGHEGSRLLFEPPQNTPIAIVALHLCVTLCVLRALRGSKPDPQSPTTDLQNLSAYVQSVISMAVATVFQW